MAASTIETAVRTGPAHAGADLRRAAGLRRLLPAAALRHDGELVQGAGRDPRRQHAGAAGARHHRALDQGLEPGADRRSADRARALLPELDQDGGAGGGHLHAAGRAQRLRAHQVALSGRYPRLRADAVRLLHPLPDRAHPHGPGAGLPRHRRHHLGPGAGARGLRAGLHHALLPQLLRGVPDRAGEGGADRRGQLPAHLLSHPAAELRPHHRGHGDLAVHQRVERLSCSAPRSPISIRSR